MNTTTPSHTIIETDANGEALALVQLINDFNDPTKRAKAKSCLMAMVSQVVDRDPKSVLPIYLITSRSIELHEAEARTV